MKKSALLKVDNLWVEGRPPGGTYTPIVKGVSFAVKPGEVLALIGESGSGKSTILLSTMAYARPGCRISDGSVVLDGTNVLDLTFEERRELRGKRVTYVAQSAAAAFNPAMTINRQVTEIARVHGLMDSAAAVTKAEDLYQKLDLPEPDKIGNRYPHQVSGGQLQRLMAAMALLSDPDLVVFDEPTTALDVTTQIEVLKAFKDIIKTQKTAAIYVTHDLAVVSQMADQIIVLLNGETVEQGTTKQIIHKPKQDYTKALMAAVRKTPTEELTTSANGNDSDADKVLEVDNVTATYAASTMAPVLRQVSVDVKRKETIGIIGESGCGKSTLARVIAGLLPPIEGEILLNGKPLPGELHNRSKDELQRSQLVYQMADVALNPSQKIEEILGRPLTFYKGIDGEERRKEVARILQLVELPASFAGRYPRELSGGQKQRVNLARALAAEPNLILCDEVTSALDTVVAAAVIELLKELQERLGVSYLFISHDISTVASFANRVVVLYAGRVVEFGPTDKVLSPPFHPYSKLLLSSVPETRQGWLEEVSQTSEAAAGIAKGVVHTAVGCPFANRCPLVIEGTCAQQDPPVRMVSKAHEILCHREVKELSKQG